jgi:hypothetical protein
LSVQPLHDLSGGLLHQEASLTLHDTADADPVPASIFMPPAVRLGLSAECDVQALRLGLDWLYARAGALAVPITLASLAQPSFLSRLERMLAASSSRSTRRRSWNTKWNCASFAASPRPPAAGSAWRACRSSSAPWNACTSFPCPT